MRFRLVFAAAFGVALETTKQNSYRTFQPVTYYAGGGDELNRAYHWSDYLTNHRQQIDMDHYRWGSLEVHS